MERAQLLSPKDTNFLARAALVHELTGKRDDALEYLRQAFASGYSPDFVKHEPFHAELRNDPGFAAVLVFDDGERP